MILMQKPLEHGSMRTMVPDGTCQSPTNGEVCADAGVCAGAGRVVERRLHKMGTARALQPNERIQLLRGGGLKLGQTLLPVGGGPE
jgi:hypothetical protein